MISKVMRALAVAGVATGLLVGGAAATQASPLPAGTTGVAVIAPHASCPRLNFCVFTGPDFTGKQYNWSACNLVHPINLVGAGSWINNQSSGVRADMYGVNGVNKPPIFETKGAYSDDPNGNWTPVFSIVVCHS